MGLSLTDEFDKAVPCRWHAIIQTVNKEYMLFVIHFLPVIDRCDIGHKAL